jgi:quercetin dioxygenase-like cupin family protein
VESKSLAWSDDAAAPLLEQFAFRDADADAVIVGTGHFRSGQRMPKEGFSSYCMREITVVLEGAIETRSGDKTVILTAGDIVTIPPNERQVSQFLEDTKLVYIFFGSKDGLEAKK